MLVIKTLLFLPFLCSCFCHEVGDFILVHRNNSVSCNSTTNKNVESEHHCLYHCIYLKDCISFNVLPISSSTKYRCKFFNSSQVCPNVSNQQHGKYFMKRFNDCSHLHDAGVRANGVYVVSPDGRKAFQVYCRMNEREGWTVVYRYDKSNEHILIRTWDECKHGFGDPDKDFWLGNENLYLLTRRGGNSMMVLQNEREKYLYMNFLVESEQSRFRSRCQPGSLPNLCNGEFFVGQVRISHPMAAWWFDTSSADAVVKFFLNTQKFEMRIHKLSSEQEN